MLLSSFMIVPLILITLLIFATSSHGSSRWEEENPNSNSLLNPEGVQQQQEQQHYNAFPPQSKASKNTRQSRMNLMEIKDLLSKLLENLAYPPSASDLGEVEFKRDLQSQHHLTRLKKDAGSKRKFKKCSNGTASAAGENESTTVGAGAGAGAGVATAGTTASGSGSQSEPKFSKWNEWSACSVTCGKGRQIRWRQCEQSCDGVETEMEEKTCQLPACENKLFGFIKL